MNNRTKLILICVLLAGYLVLPVLPQISGLSLEGIKSLYIMISAVIVWSTSAIPLAVSAMLFSVLPVFAGLMNMPTMLSNFAAPTFMFLFGMFVMTIAFQNSGLSRRIVLWSILKSGGSTRKMLFCLMAVCSICSWVMADIPTIALFLPICLMLLKENNCIPGKSRYGKSIMLGLTFAALVGGMGTPAGSVVNVMTMDMLQKITGVQINFWQWACVGIPTAVILLPIAYFILVWMYPPEIETIAGLEGIKKAYEDLGSLTAKERNFAILGVLNIIVWFISSPLGLPLPLLVVISAAVFALPALDLVDWSQDSSRVGWEVILMASAAAVLGTMLWDHGVAKWLASVCLSPIAGMNTVWAIAFLSAFTILIHFVIPTSAALVAILLPALITLAETLGVNAAMLAMPLALSLSACLLIPLDPSCLLTLQTGYFRFGEFWKPGSLLSIAWVIVLSMIMILVGGSLTF